MSDKASKNAVRLLSRTPQKGLPEFFELGAETCTVGRHPTNTVTVPLDSISRFHARLDKRGDFFMVQDLNSSNGTFVNGERVTQMTLHHGDIVTFGGIEFLFSNEGSQSGMSTAGLRGKSIVDIKEDRETKEAAPTTQSVIKAEEVRDKSSVISAADKKADKTTLMRLNNRLSTLYRLSELLREAASEREETILTRVLDLLFDAVVADRGVIMTKYSPESTEFDVAAVKYRDAPIVAQKVSISRTILDQVVNQKVAVLSRDAMADNRFDASESIVANQIRSAIAVPMMFQGKVMGVLHLDTSSSLRLFNDEDLEFVTMIASEVSVALENSRMRREAAHRERLAAVGETVAGISHNVKNILLLSQGGAELLNRALKNKDMEGANDSWAVVQRGIEKIGKLVKDMLEYSTSKRPTLTVVDVNEMICAIAEEVEEQLVRKGVTLELELDESVAGRKLDEPGLQRTLANLIVNSMEAIRHQEGRIIVSTTQRTDAARTLVIGVKDNGSGISKDKLERIFLPFYTTKGSSGTGLGLPMCRKVVEDLGGTIRVESEENVGTTFIIELPVVTKNADASQTGND